MISIIVASILTIGLLGSVFMITYAQHKRLFSKSMAEETKAEVIAQTVSMEVDNSMMRQEVLKEVATLRKAIQRVQSKVDSKSINDTSWN